jgi:hypothetical protein
MSTIALIDTRLKIPGESIGTVVSTHETIRAAFKANEAFQKRMRESGVKDHVPTKIVTLKVRLGDGERWDYRLQKTEHFSPILGSAATW